MGPFLYSHNSECISCLSRLDIEINLFEQDDGAINIPLKRAGNLFYVEARINDLEGNFLLDLGAPYLVLNSTYFRDYVTDISRSTGTLLSSSNYAKTTQIQELNIRGLRYTNLKADITDLAEIENRRDVKIFGLFGVDLFKDYIIEIDVKKRVLILHQNRKSIEKEPSTVLDIPIQIKNNSILIKAQSNQKKITLCLDTAAELCILDNGLSKKVYEGMRVLKALSTVDANGAETEVLNTVFNSITIDGVPFKQMNTLVVNLKSMSRAYGHNIDGMLGYPFLVRGRLIIDFDEKRLQIFNFKK